MLRDEAKELLESCQKDAGCVSALIERRIITPSRAAMHRSLTAKRSIGVKIGLRAMSASFPLSSMSTLAALIGQVVGGGAGGAILTVLAGVTKWIVVPPKST